MYAGSSADVTSVPVVVFRFSRQVGPAGQLCRLIIGYVRKEKEVNEHNTNSILSDLC
jgi:hypothetical protein